MEFYFRVVLQGVIFDPKKYWNESKTLPLPTLLKNYITKCKLIVNVLSDLGNIRRYIKYKMPIISIYSCTCILIHPPQRYTSAYLNPLQLKSARIMMFNRNAQNHYGLLPSEDCKSVKAARTVRNYTNGP